MNMRLIMKERIRALKLSTKACIKDPTNVKYFLPYYKSLITKDYLLKNELPWIVFKATDFLKRRINKNMKVFEFGMGGSTLFFSKRVKELVSIEHNPGWYFKIKNILKKKKVCNYKCILIKPTALKNGGGISAYSSDSQKYKNKSFETYIKTIDQYKDSYFDMVFIDGRSRVSCIKHSIKKIRKGGFLILDNSDRDNYSGGTKLLSEWQQKYFFGLGPVSENFWGTTIWRKSLR